LGALARLRKAATMAPQALLLVIVMRTTQMVTMALGTLCAVLFAAFLWLRRRSRPAASAPIEDSVRVCCHRRCRHVLSWVGHTKRRPMR
jgi:hypothetical protein